MSCSCLKSGQTKLASILIAGVPTATQQTYSINLVHGLCGNKRMCITANYAPSCTLTYKLMDTQLVGNNTYECDIQISGVLSYMPIGCCCPKTESIFCNISVPVVSSTGVPTITLNGTNAVVNASGVKDCTNTANAVNLGCSLVVNSVEPTK